MQYVFGPVASRRLGRSLGVDPLPLKTCNWSCVYCQLGRTTPLSLDRREYTPREAVIAELREVLSSPSRPRIDWITFAGSGEPALHAGLGWMLREARTLTELPIAVITNGSLLENAAVRAEMGVATAVLPSLDAGSDRLFRRINRSSPHQSFDRLVQGLIDFRRGYKGLLWIEVMLVKGINDTPQALADLCRVLRAIGADAIHVNLPIRPPAELRIEPPDEATLLQAETLFGRCAPVLRPVRSAVEEPLGDDIADAIAQMVARHPMTEEDLVDSLRDWPPAVVDATLVKLRTDGRVRMVEREGCRFWSAAGATYAG